MKKILAVSSLLALSLSVPTFAQDVANPPEMPPAINAENKNPDFQNRKKPNFEKKRAEFENRLQLTDEQKAKAKALREQGRKDMEPVMNELRIKHQEMKKLKEANAPKEDFDKLRAEVQVLHKKMHEQRMKNMKDFEAILTKKQLKELNKIKEEGRKDFKKHHPQRPPHRDF